MDTPDASFLASNSTLAFAVDDLTYATRSDTSIAKSLTVAQLQQIYNCQVGTIQPMLPQFGSATRKSLLTSLGFTDAADFASQFGHTCIKQTDTNGNPLPENTGNLLSAANQIEPYSVPRFVAQYNGQEPDVHGLVILREINGVPPLELNTSSIMSRDVYNVVPSIQLDFGTEINRVFVGPSSQLCTNAGLVKQFGFGANSNCGSTSIQTPP